MESWPAVSVAALGAYHGLNPAMGWLFAVALGLQERRLAAVFQSLIPIALGHGASVGLTLLVVNGLGFASGPEPIRLIGGGVLVLFGLFRLLRPRWHPKWVGFRLTLPELAWWSFLMSTAHGAGLMLLPIALGGWATEANHAAASHANAGASFVVMSGMTLVHTASMLLTMAAVGGLVYGKLGVGVLRRAWINLDLVWAASLIIAGAITLFT